MSSWIGVLAVGLALVAAPAARAQQQAAITATAHIHGPACGHYFHDGGWHDFPSAHIHSADCGHFFYDGGWHLFAQGHAHSASCGHFFYEGDWHVVAQGHIHGIGCGHEFVDGEWRDAAPQPAALEAPPPPRPPAPREVPIPQSGVVEPVPPPLRRLEPIRIVFQQDPRVYTFSGSGIIVVAGPHHHGFSCGHYYYSGGWNDAPPTCLPERTAWCRPEPRPVAIANPWVRLR